MCYCKFAHLVLLFHWMIIFYWNLGCASIQNCLTLHCSEMISQLYYEFLGLHLGISHACDPLLQVYLTGFYLYTSIYINFICPLSFAARGYTSAYMNPSLAYGLTFHCPGFTLTEYALVYWLGPLTGKTHSDKYMCICSLCFKSDHCECLFSRHDAGSSPVHGTHSKDFCQEPFLFAEDTFQSAKGRQRRQEENVKKMFLFSFKNF